MIKNELQLRQAQNRYNEILKTIEDLEERYSGTRLRIMKSGFVEELTERREEIREYRQLRRLDLEAAIQGPLSEKPALLDNINEFLTKLRIAAGVTQEEIAERLGWHQPNVSRFESEDYGGQTISKVVEYADSLGVWLYIAPSLAGPPPKIAHQREVKSPSIHTRDRRGIQVRVRTRQTEDTSASIRSGSGVEDTELNTSEFEVYDYDKERIPEPVTA
jgi:transcriptional regulator with XRE-family HTH domain